MRTPYLTALAALVLGTLAVAIYWPGLHGGFFFDDGPSILLADGVRLQALSRESLQQAWASGGAGPSGRPVAQLSFALNHFFHGFSPLAFKATNLAIHLACAALVFALTLQLFRQTATRAAAPQYLLASGAVAALWLLHPIQLLPVLHVVQRMTSLSAMFLLTALLAHLRGREHGGRAGAAWLALAWAALWPLSFLSKETGVLLPLLVLAWELTVRRNSADGLDRFARWFAAAVALGLAMALAYALSARAQWLWSGYELRSFSLMERVLTEGRVLWFYLGLIVAPRLEVLGLYHDDMALSTDLLAPWTTLPAMTGLLALVWLAWWLRRRAPLVAFGIAWFLIGHLLESTVLPLELAHEHRNYLPLWGILLAGGAVLLQALASQGSRKTIAVALTASALIYIPFVTALRSHQFGDDVRRTQIEAQHHRNSARAQHEAGVALAGLSDATVPDSSTHTFARRHYELANRLDPAFKMGSLALIQLNCQAGLAPDPVVISELSRRLRETAFAPGDKSVLYNLKQMAIADPACLNRSQVDAAFAAALANRGVTSGVQAMLYSWHADYLWLQARDLAAARTALTQSLSLNPANQSNRLKQAQLLVIGGEHVQARQLLLELKALNFPAEERTTLTELLAAYNMADR